MKSFRLVLLILLAVKAPAFATVTVSSPSSGSTVTSPVNYVASAAASTCSKGVASMGIKVNNKFIYIVHNNQLNTEITLATGVQHTVVQEWDHCGKSSYTKVNLTVVAPDTPTVSITANPPAIASGSTSTLTVTAANANSVIVTGSDGTSDNPGTAGGTWVVSPVNTTTYTATATGSGGTTASASVTVWVNALPTVTISANPATIPLGDSSTLMVTATAANSITVGGSDNSSYTVGAGGGNVSVNPTTTVTYTATAIGAAGATATANTQVTVGPKALTSISVSPNPATFAIGSTQQFAATATYTDSSTSDVTQTADWSVANTAVATIDNTGLATAEVAGSTTVTASLNGVSGKASISVTVAPGTEVSVPTWHFDTYRSGLNASETSLSATSVSSSTFGKLFTYLVDGYAYAQPLLVSNVTISGTVHNVLYVATESNNVYAFDADHYGTGAPLWQVSLNQAGENADRSGPIVPYEGVTSTPVIDLTSNTMYVVSKHSSKNGSFFRLNALDITTGLQKLGGPVKIHASVPATNSSAVHGVQTLTTSCTQRSALLEAYGNVYFGFGGCHTGWLLGYDAQTLKRTGVFNASPNLNGEGEWASAGGVWMGGGGAASNGDGYVYITTGNGPWDGKTAWSDSVLKLDPTTLAVEDYFTPQIFQYMDCADGDLAAGGLLLIPGTTQALAAGKLAYLYLVNTTDLGHEQAGDAGALWTGAFESDLMSQSSKSCLDANGTTYTIKANYYEIYGTSAYFNGSVYLGISATQGGTRAGLRQFALSGNTLTRGSYTHDGTQEGDIRGTTPFVSANGTSDGVVWMIDQGFPLQSSAAGAPTTATLRAFDPNDLAIELYDSNRNPEDAPGYGIKFTSPIVANGKVYISTGHDPTTVKNPQGEIDVYGLN
jgi:hypothetical protein